MKNNCIYALDDYSVHIIPKVKEAVLQRGYWYIQINDTDIHAPLKREYCKLEQELMINQLQYDPKKIPQPTRDDMMMRMLFGSIQNINVDIPACYNALCLTSALNGSEDYLVSDKTLSLVGDDLKKF